jgi:hypothetical protein
MESTRWPRIVAAGIAVVAGAVCLGRPVVAGVAAAPAWDPPPCAARVASPPSSDAGAWYRLDPALDGTGSLAGRHLQLGTAGDATRRMALVAESFASGPVGGLVLVGEDDGTRSRLRLLDPGRGCAVAVADETAVVRSALLASDGSAVLEHRVDRASRVDLGVWRRPLDGAAPARLLPGIAADDPVGRVFTTDLRIAADGRLVVSSCGLASCVVRVLDPDGRTVVTIRDTGPAVGVSRGEVVVRTACGGYPCAVEAVDLASGRHRALVDAAYAAELTGSADATLVIETGDGEVASVDVATGRRDAAGLGSGAPLPHGSIATSGAETPRGSLAIAPGGRASAGGVRALDPAAGTSPGLEEIVR